MNTQTLPIRSLIRRLLIGAAMLAACLTPACSMHHATNPVIEPTYAAQLPAPEAPTAKLSTAERLFLDPIRQDDPLMTVVGVDPH